ncbi:MAG: hypothetical protein AAGI03_04165, partial [Pseudomonadota bacterium]
PKTKGGSMPNQHKPSPPMRPPSEVASAEKGAERPTLHLDTEEWLPYLDDPDATEEEKRELIETLWGIVLSFVDLGWQITAEDAGPSQLPPDQTEPSIDLTRALHAAVVQSDDHQQMEEA